MANLKKLDSSKLLGPKKDFIKNNNPNDIETAVKQIHQAGIEKEKTSRVSVDTPVTMLKDIKRRMLDRDIKTIKDYFLDLARKDLIK
jgi:hypothetical protein